MQRRNRQQNRMLSGGVTLFVTIFCGWLVLLYDWTEPASPQFTTQALDCTQGVVCDRDGICDSSCETSATCAVDCPSSSACGNRQCEDTETYQSCPSDCAQGFLDTTNGTKTYIAGCSARNSSRGVELGGIECSISCPNGTGENFDCVYTGSLLSSETNACDNGLDDDGSGGTDCQDSDCFGTAVCCSNQTQDGDEVGVDCGGSCAEQCVGGSSGDVVYQESDDVNGQTGSLFSYFGSADYLLIALVESECAACHTTIGGVNAFTSMQQTLQQGKCNFITLVHPSYYNGSLSDRLGFVGPTSFVGVRSKKGGPGSVAAVESLFGFGTSDWNPKSFLIDKNGAVLATSVIGNNGPSQAFTTYCGSGGTTTTSTTTASTTTAGTTDAGTTTAGSTTEGSTDAGTTTAGSTSAGTTTAGNTTGVDNNNDGIPDASQSGYVRSTVTNTNGTAVLTIFSGDTIQQFSQSSVQVPTTGIYPGGVLSFRVVTNSPTTNAQLRFKNTVLQSGFDVSKRVNGARNTLSPGWYTMTQQGLDVVLNYTLQDNNPLFDANSTTGVIDDPITIGCSDPNNDGFCGGIASTGGTTTGGTETGTVSCADGIMNGTETDRDCGGVCGKCVNGNRCIFSSDCASANCAYNVLGTQEVQGTAVTASRTLTTQSIQSTGKIQTAQSFVENALYIKFKKENELLLPTFSQDVVLNSEERYLGYLLGKTATLYEQQGVAPLLMVRAVDQLFDEDVARIDHAFTAATTNKSGNDDLAHIYRVTFDGSTDIDTMITTLQNNLAVEYVEKEPVYQINYTDVQAAQQRYLTTTEADKARDAGASGSAAIVVAVIDNGFDLSHPDLQGVFVQGYDAANGDTDPSIPAPWYTDPVGSGAAGHGTHVAGLVAAATNNALGVASIGGGVRVMPIKATADSAVGSGIGGLSLSAILAAMQYAVNQSQVQVISMSFGGYQYNATMEQLVNAYPSKLFVAAAGNDGVSTQTYPAAYSPVVAVASSDQNDQRSVFSSFFGSNYGTWIDITAPGSLILSTLPSLGTPGGRYGLQSGTSMATPIVAGLLALLRSLGDINPLQTMLRTAVAMPNEPFYIQQQMGAGRINVCKAVNSLGYPCSSTQSSGLGKGICLASGSTGTGSTTGQTGTGSTGTGVILSGNQQYPSGTITLTPNKSEAKQGETIQWTLNRSYTTHAPNYPAGTVDMFIDFPPGISFVSGSYSLLGNGSFQGYDVNGGDPVFVMKMTGTPTSTNSTSKTFAGTLIFKSVISTANGYSIQVPVELLCYDIPLQAYQGTITCSTNKNRESGLLMSSYSAPLTVNKLAIISTGTTAGTGKNQTGTQLICGNGVLEGNEECDDANTQGGDGCVSCTIDAGWRCLPTSPSQCGTDDCFTHGEAYKENNIFGTCCGGLSSLEVVPSTKVITGTISSFICYDSLIANPYCDPEGSPAGWRVKRADGTVKFVQGDSCRAIYKDYYEHLVADLHGERAPCVFGDVAYDQVSFKDIKEIKQKAAIDILRDACIVQGIGQDLNAFGPHRPILRAELIKIVSKLITLSEGGTGTGTFAPLSGASSNALFLDVPADFWGTEYIQDAINRGLLFARAKQGLMTFFKPYATVTRTEFIDLVRRIPQGQTVSRDTIEDIIGRRAVVTRAAAVEVLVKKFLPTLQPYFYYQGKQEEYYRELAERLKGKNYQQQYDILLDQIDALEEKKKEEHLSPEQGLGFDYNPYWMQQYVRDIIR